MSDNKKSVDQKFTREQRLLLPSDYKFVFNQPTRSSDKLLTILAKHNQTKDQARLGLAVAKKSVKTAVHRNRIKRLTREFFRLNQDKLACADYVILVRNGIDKMDNEVITQSLAKQFNYLRKKLA
ncbi:MAG: ribonuclease P protein component [Gammaproteobacteria bacterium]|nr:ribonuclease P protein component [Gammaproteobacteria bacterium]